MTDPIRTTARTTAIERQESALATNKVLRNTYLLLALTLLFSAATAGTAMALQMPYLGPVIGTYTDWTPLTGRQKLFPEDLDLEDPWQFKNIIVR